jgi:hypothetical protein
VPFGGYDSEPDDATYAIRATAACALQSQQIAEQVYGQARIMATSGEAAAVALERSTPWSTSRACGTAHFPI